MFANRSCLSLFSVLPTLCPQLALRWKSATTALGYVRELSARDNAAADYLRERRGRRGQGR